MILYTILPEEAVFADEEEFEESVKEQREIAMEGRRFVVEPVSEEEWRVVRLISSNPQDYLEEKYQPGKIIPIKPQF